MPASARTSRHPERPSAHRAPATRALGLATLAWLLFVAYQSLAGGVAGDCVVPLSQQGRRLSWSDGIANFAAYVPLGMLAVAWIGSRGGPRGRVPPTSLLVALLAIAAFSLSMELAQACLARRVSSWFDLATNVAGGLAGLATMRAVLAMRSDDVASRAGSQAMLALVLFTVVAWLAMGLSPWRFTFDVGTIRGNLAFLRGISSWAGPEPWGFARHLCGWIAIGLAWRVVWPGRAAATLALVATVAVSVVLQLLLVRRALGIDELLAMAAAIVVAIGLPSRGSGGWYARLLPALALAAVCAYQLAPGRGRVSAAAFDWLPQLGRGGLLGALELALMFGWLALSIVLGLRWLAATGARVSRARVGWPLLAVTVLFATELAQTWIPGRHPDISPPLFTALGFAVAWALFGVRREQAFAGGRVRAPATTRSRRLAA